MKKGIILLLFGLSTLMLQSQTPTLWTPDAKHYDQVGRMYHVGGKYPSTRFEMADGTPVVTEDELMCSLDGDEFCIIAWVWRGSRGLGAADTPAAGIFLYRMRTGRRHPGEIGIDVGYGDKTARYYRRQCESNRLLETLCDLTSAQVLAKRQSDDRETEELAMKAAKRDVDLNDCLRALRVGMSRVDVYKCGAPLHVNSDLLGGDQLVYPGDTYVYLNKDGRVEDVQWTD